MWFGWSEACSSSSPDAASRLPDALAPIQSATKSTAVIVEWGSSLIEATIPILQGGVGANGDFVTRLRAKTTMVLHHAYCLATSTKI
jgi:hypothetical protein